MRRSQQVVAHRYGAMCCLIARHGLRAPSIAALILAAVLTITSTRQLVASRRLDPVT
jgi:hypothetical protein